MAEGFLLDTNVISETRKTRPLAALVSFLNEADPQSLFLSVLTVGELHKGVEGKRRQDPTMARELARWVEGLEQNFTDRIVPVDTHMARLWGELSATPGRPVIDTLLAATAMVRGLTLVTRNVRDFPTSGLVLLDPWQGASTC